MLSLFASCGSGGLEGTYVPKNDAAKQIVAKFEFQPKKSATFFGKVFEKNTVKFYMSIGGIVMPMASECSYSIKGDKLILEEGIPGVNGRSLEFLYDSDRDLISFDMNVFFDMFGGIAEQVGSAYGNKKVNAGEVSAGLKQLANQNGVDITPVWGKEGMVYIPTKNPIAESSQTEPEQDSNNKIQVSFNQQLAERLAEYSDLVYGDGGENREREITYGSINSRLKQDGYTNIKNYKSEIENGIGCTLAYQEARNELVVAVRGTKWEEWKGNMDIGKDNVLHESFQKANKLLQNNISDYIMEYKLENVNFVITGHSRGAAVANLLAVDLNKNDISVPFNGWNTVCAYTFATPNNSRNFQQKGYENIFNFCLDDDFVTRIPLDNTFSNWGYGKFGITYRAVASGLYAINENFKKLEDKDCPNPYFNLYAVETLLQEVYQTAPSVKSYYEKLLKMGITVQVKGITVFEEKDKTLYDFMRDYVAQSTIDNERGKKFPLTGGIVPQSSAIVGLAAKALSPIGNDVHTIADFFVDIENLTGEKYIMDTHNSKTYVNALKANGFQTK